MSNNTSNGGIFDQIESSADTGYSSDFEDDSCTPSKSAKRVYDGPSDVILQNDVWWQSSEKVHIKSEIRSINEKHFTKDDRKVAYFSYEPIKIIFRRTSSSERDNTETFDIHKRLNDVHITEQAESEREALWKVISHKDMDGDNLLFISIILLNTHIACMFIDLAPSYGVLNNVNKLLQTALHIAALTGNHIVARRLLVAGATVDMRDFRLNTALHLATTNGNINVVKQLLKPVTYLEAKKNKYDIPFQKIPQNMEIFNHNGESCLHIAARKKNKTLIDLLLENEANINVRELKSGKTILHYFAEDDDVEMVKYIITKSRIDLNMTTYYGITAAELAHSRGHFAIAYLLLSTGSNDVFSFYSSSSDSDSDDSDSYNFI